MKPESLLSQGAEAKIILVESSKKTTSLIQITPSGVVGGGGDGLSEVVGKKFILKQRIKKSYRLPEIDDKIRKLRTRNEGKLLEKASKIVNIPKINSIDEKIKEISMEYIDGKKLSSSLDDFSLELQKKILKQIGNEIGKLHDSQIIHGDLTTSNMIYVGMGGNFKIYFIDFGLGFISNKYEDKAVDIHLLKQALETKHFKHWEILFEEFSKGYIKSKEGNKVLQRLKEVEKRGRYKDKY